MEINETVEAMSVVLDYLDSQTSEEISPIEENEEDGFKHMPYWVCHHLAVYDNCFINTKLYRLIKDDLKEFFGNRKYEVMMCEDGGYVVWAR